MGLPKGVTNNPAGRPPGSRNKVTTELKQWITDLVHGNRQQFEEDLKKIEPAQRLAVLEKLIQYVIPRQQAIDINTEIRALEVLMEKTPGDYIEKIALRIIELNQINKEHETRID
jgi:hypothetical protein